MSSFKKWLLIVIVTLALLHMGFGSLSDILRTGQHGWTEALILMLLAIVVAIAVR
jgi:hypothetical protein